MARFAAETQSHCDLEILMKMLKTDAQPIGIALWLVDLQRSNLLAFARAFEAGGKSERLMNIVLNEWEFSFKQHGTFPNPA